MGILGIDVGGTFTDLLFLDEESGTVKVAKVPSTPGNVENAVLAAMEQANLDVSGIELFVHGTTIVTNAIIERTGAVVGLVTTRGFRDVLELGRRSRNTVYGLGSDFEPLIPRNLRLEVEERMDDHGSTVVPLDEDEVRRVGEQLVALGAQVVVVSFLHSYANAKHELRAAEILRSLDDWMVVGSAEVSPQFYEFERTSTATLHAFVQPIVDEYIEKLTDRLAQRGYVGDILFVQSSGGLMTSEVARSRPANLAVSGPAAGVTAASVIAQQAGFDNVISADMGGTSFDVCLIPEGIPQTADERDMGFRMPLRVPTIDVETIGAGGGSIAWIDRGGILQIGPNSAGADPGPAAYGRGGSGATVTDANVVLGRIGSTTLLGERHAFDVDAAERAILENVASPMDMSVQDAALAIVDVANHKMAGRIRMVSVERGFDPRDFALVAFGGAGPLHAAALTKDVNIGRCLIPVFPGVLCALGCVVADVRHDYVQSVIRPVTEIDYEELSGDVHRIITEGTSTCLREGIERENVSTIIFADMAYGGQRHHIPVPLEAESVDLMSITAAFEDAYRSEYGRLLEGLAVRLLAIRIAVLGGRPSTLRTNWGVGMAEPEGTRNGKPRIHRPVTFRDGTFSTPVYLRAGLVPGTQLEGPAIVEQDDTTTVLDPGIQAIVDDQRNMILEAK